ncbi:SprT-like domain-containing protein [Zooshikella sp. RANM57]|uniref:SprT-like domain-containing protein n=1 Tax=Zooshikella sp. RANM57 TaxID=3425863 RepID=UPI003D6F2A2F
MPYQALAQRINLLLKQAEAHYQCYFTFPEFILDLRGSVAGQANWHTNQLRFNPALLKQHTEHFLKHTVAHEVAHLVAPKVYGHTIKPHGREWRFVMETVFGVTANRCHRYDISATGRYPYVYACACKHQHFLSAIRHKRTLRGTTYLCQKCRATLQFQHKLQSEHHG